VPDDIGPEDQEQEQGAVETIDTVKLRISLKSLRSDMMSFDNVPFDTSLENIHLQHQLKKELFFVSHLGNLGLAAQPINYFQQQSNNDFFFINPVRYNFIHKEDILYYTTNKPFSNISYNSSGSRGVDLQAVRFLHTQNVNRNLNVGTLLSLHGSNGLYQRQKSNSNALSLFSSYDGDYYNLNAVFSYNTLKNEENGGIANDTLFETDEDKGSVYPVALQGAGTNLKNTYFFLSQRFNLAGVRDLIDKDKNDSIRKFSGIGLLHVLELDRNKRLYTDENGVADVVPYKYYNKYNIDDQVTDDSLSFFRLNNSLELLLGKQNPNEPPLLIRAGIKSLYDKYSYSIVPDTLITLNLLGQNDTTLQRNMFGNSYNNLAFTGGISIGIKSFFLLNAHADYFFAGYKAGDLYMHGKLTNRLGNKPGSLSFNILMDIARYKPGYFLDRYFSNHFDWKNGFIPVKEIRTGIEIKWPALKFDADFKYALLSSPVYFNENAVPVQHDGEISVLEASAAKGLKAGIFHTSFKAMLQVASDDKVIPLPLFSAYNSSYIEVKLFKKVMTTQLGYDLRFNTEYFIHGYMPDLGTFYNQRLRKIGNYPYADVFLNVKLKRMRFYLKYEHVNSDLVNREYYTVLHYPVNSRMLMFGLSWNFYD
jgi:hypothetical protein